MKAQEIANKLGLTLKRASYEYYYQNEIPNDVLIDQLQDLSTRCYSQSDAELFVMSDGSCINRQGDEYFINDNVDLLDQDYLTSVGY